MKLMDKIPGVRERHKPSDPCKGCAVSFPRNAIYLVFKIQAPTHVLYITGKGRHMLFQFRV
jgi:hypothetical protein